MSTEVKYGYIYSGVDPATRRVLGRYIMWDIVTGAPYCEECCGEIFDPSLKPGMENRVVDNNAPMRCANCKRVIL